MKMRNMEMKRPISKFYLIANVGILSNLWVLWMASHIIHQWVFHISSSYLSGKNYTKQFLQLALSKYKTKQHCLIWSSCLSLPAWKETMTSNLIQIMLGWFYLWFLVCALFPFLGFVMTELMWKCYHRFCPCYMNVFHVCAHDVSMNAWLHVYHVTKFCWLEFTSTWGITYNWNMGA